MRAQAAISLLAALAGCQPGRDDTPPAPAESGVTASPSPAAAAPAKPPGAGKGVLDAEGIAFAATAGKTGSFRFGTNRAIVDEAAARGLGREGARTALGECGAGAMEFTAYGGLTLNYLDGMLVGWRAGEGAPAVTSDGIRPGALLRDLKVARSVRMIEDSTLEGEFDYLAADGQTIGGFVLGEGRDARIASLHAGTNCFFR